MSRQLKLFVVPDPAPYALHLANYLKTKQLLAAETKKLNRRVLAQFCRAAGWPPSLNDVTEFMADCQARGLAANTVLTYFDVICGFIRYLNQTAAIDPINMAAIRRPPTPANLPRAPSVAALDAFFAHLERQVEQVVRQGDLRAGWLPARDLALFSILYDCGLRVGELVGLEVSDVDLGGSSLFIRRAKRGKQRLVYFARVARGDLRLWLRARELLDPKATVKALFITTRRGPRGLKTAAVRSRLLWYCRLLGIEHITPHQLRHAYAAHSLKYGADLETLQRSLGHSSSVMTMRYARLAGDAARDVQRRASPRDRQFDKS